MRRLLVNDALCQLGEYTFWNCLQDWFGMEFLPVPFDKSYGKEVVLPPMWDENQQEVTPSIIIRNASYLPPFTSTDAGDAGGGHQVI